LLLRMQLSDAVHFRARRTRRLVRHDRQCASYR